MFTGTYVYGMDRKGRVVMPAQFRAQLGVPFVLTRAPERHLLVLSTGQWEMLRQRYNHAPAFRAIYLASAVKCPVDRVNGRFLIPHVLREYAGLRAMDEVVLCGLGRAVQVAKRGEWEARPATGEFPGLGQLDFDLDLPSPVQAGQFQMETHAALGFPLLRCSGRMHARAARQFVSAVARLLNAKPVRLWVDLRGAGEIEAGLRLLECLPQVIETPVWLLGELPTPAGVRVLPDLESAVWALEDGR